MAGMQQVVAAVREHNSTPSGLFTGHPAQQFFLADYPSQRLPSASDLAYFAHNFTTRAALALSYNAVSLGHEVLTISASFLEILGSIELYGPQADPQNARASRTLIDRLWSR